MSTIKIALVQKKAIPNNKNRNLELAVQYIKEASCMGADTVADRCENDSDYKTAVSVKTAQGFDLLLRSKNYYDEETQTQFSPAIYELYNGTKLLQSEPMDFQTHLYKFGEMEHYLKEIGFTTVKTYSSFEKERAVDDQCEMFLFECSMG